MQKTNSSLEPPGLRWSWEVPTPRRGSAAPFPSQLLNRDPLGALDPTSRRHPHAARQAGAAAALAKASRRRDHAGGQRDARLARPTDARNLALPRVPECRDCARAAPSLAWWRGEAGPSGGGGGGRDTWLAELTDARGSAPPSAREARDCARARPWASAGVRRAPGWAFKWQTVLEKGAVSLRGFSSLLFPCTAFLSCFLGFVCLRRTPKNACPHLAGVCLVSALSTAKAFLHAARDPETWGRLC